MKARDIVGRRVVRIRQYRTFAREDTHDRNGNLLAKPIGKDPYTNLTEIELDNGTVITFSVQETDFGEYGIIATPYRKPSP